MPVVDLVVVDGPNVCHRVCDYLLSLTADRELVRDYFLEWFDISRLVLASLGAYPPDQPKQGIVIFHSLKDLGRKLKITGEFLHQFWRRQGTSPNSSSHPVIVGGEQKVAYKGTCPDCNKEVILEETSEKGVDAEIICYLFETSARWESVCLFTTDGDFGPPVLALRRRGQQVFVSSNSDDSRCDIARYAQSFYPHDCNFLRQDFATYQFLRKDGQLDRLIPFLKGFPEEGLDIRITVPVGGHLITATPFRLSITTRKDQAWLSKQVYPKLLDHLYQAGTVIQLPETTLTPLALVERNAIELTLANSWPLSLGVALNAIATCSQGAWWNYSHPPEFPANMLSFTSST